MTRNTLVVGFLLFAIFFGAGNLIFPPKLGFESGAEFASAISGFVLTGVGLPLLGIVVSAFYNGGYKSALDKIHPYFSLIFLISIYLAIGPFFAGPRTAATAYEMALMPFLGESSQLSMLIFTLVYFVLTLWLAINPTKVVDRIGAVLTPILLIAIIALVVRASMILTGDSPLVATQPTEQSYFFKGMVDGYLTMDALASLAYSVIVLHAIRGKSTSQASLQRQTVAAGLVAAVALAVIYIGLGWIGNNIPMSAETLAMLAEKKLDMGTYILNTITTQAFGELGRAVLGIIVSLACLTTAVGLAVSVSEYFNEIFPKISYKVYAILFTVISFIIANQGLKEVISKSIPVLLVLYPIAMTIIFMLLINLVIKLPLTAQRLSLLLVTVVAIASVAGVGFTESLPLKAYSMEWLPFAVIGCVVGAILHPLISRKA
ncbi:branched-chain amino acid ABC transporter substrate-binding protein [Mannheimia granulomatis]|uniref:Branched-chain amino acid transport system carrier protein n=1 Tax=Mannheimia granulomatis TaxID=85402 RepID=A0A011MIL4_9PAST|nr:branched-chain amino acid transport system II carrier protein [Mannheimia granulomatis]EXI62321.1 branched-chain amino acid ABC transporter substrate-binding protein [Mannheimia granulomatis]RGE47805.1 branched-chain amino acid ABC transporter substrate-binding protein [Mannheimia granulomatis]